MRVIVVEAPTAPVVTWEEAERHLRLDGDTSMRMQVEAMIEAATAHLSGPDGWLGRSLAVQTLEARLANFDCELIRLPYGPVVEIVSVAYINDAGTEQTIAPGDYEILGAQIVPAFGKAWPMPRAQREAVRIRYRAGYAPTDDTEPKSTLPPAIRAAILLMVGDLWANRETAAPSANAAQIPMSTTVENLLAPLRVFL